MNGDFQKRKKKDLTRFQGYIPVDLREEVEKADDYCETNGISKSEQYMRGYLEQIRKLKKEEGTFTPFDKYFQDLEESRKTHVPRPFILNQLAVELWKASKKDPEADKNILILSDALSDDEIEKLSDSAQMKIYVLRKRRAQIANKVSPNSLPTGEK